jgi:DNA-binding transcriptional LysR family regulator
MNRGHMWEVRRLRLLRELSVRGTIAAVADAMHQSPSSVSQQLTQLEREVGLPLLRKSGRGVQLTPEAEILVEHTEAILQRLELAESHVLKSVNEPVGTVRLAIFQSAALALIPRTLAQLRARHAGLRVTVTQREPETALLETFARDFDLVVAEQYPGHAAPWHRELDRDALVQDSIRLAVPAEWTGIESLAGAADVPWVAEPHGAASRHYAEQTCRLAGFDPDVRYETADLQVHVALIASGNAVALMPGLMWQGQPHPSVRLIELPGRPRRTVFTAARRSTTARPSVVAVRAALQEAAGGLAPED